LQDPKYSLLHFHSDVVAAFPELLLYCDIDNEQQTTTSGQDYATLL